METKLEQAVAGLRESIGGGAIGELNFPTSLDASRRVLKAVENPDIGLGSLAKIVIAEPLLSAKVLRLANSMALNPANQIVRDVRQAVLRVGMDPIKSLTLVLIVDQLRQSQRQSACRGLSNALWERSVHVAALAYVLTRKLTSLNADEAMFAGIVHDLGRFYLLSRLADYPVLLEDMNVLAETINDLAAAANEMVLTALNVPATIVEAVSAARVAHPAGAAQPPATLADVLFIAGVVSPRPDPFAKLDRRIGEDAAAAAATGIDRQAMSELIAASGDEIYSIIVALES